MNETLSRRVLAIPAFTLCLLGAVTVLSAPTAAADPSGCSANTNANPGKWRATEAWSYCATYRGQHRVVARCTDEDLKHWTQWGPWVGAGQRSETSCVEVNSATYELR
ncbi:hypothetical protein GCM10023321_80420 [Pseudonocardia eucalypti]|uniref:Uncharacterized protein n=1 Tax=Pseudonocardia eucalypti TaxID=648755 RepID=A0ABP9RD91_9PSEU|nr:hypothetical protein [Pseudonocardia eucalypti]